MHQKNIDFNLDAEQGPVYQFFAFILFKRSKQSAKNDKKKS